MEGKEKQYKQVLKSYRVSRNNLINYITAQFEKEQDRLHVPGEYRVDMLEFRRKLKKKFVSGADK